MKQIVLFFIFISCAQFGLAQKSSLLKFDTRQIDLGDIQQGAVVDTVFYFTNISDVDVQIDIIDACECTTLDWSLGVIPPRGRGHIKVSFDSMKKDKSDTIDIDITLINEDPRTGGPVMDNVTYKYNLIKD